MSAPPLVLVVDDDPDLRETVGIVLAAEGYRTEMAADGEEAQRALEREPPALILLDLMMPSMDGEQFLDWLDAHGPDDVVVCVMSGRASADVGAAAQTIHRRAAAVLQKPVDLETLLATVTRLTPPHDADPAGVHGSRP